MATERTHASISAPSTQPLVGIFRDDDSDVVQYFAEEPQAPSATPSRGAQDALSVIGAWSDMDWDELAESLDRIRHESPPTPPIDINL
jgi:hypothetical protein